MAPNQYHYRANLATEVGLSWVCLSLARESRKLLETVRQTVKACRELHDGPNQKPMTSFDSLSDTMKGTLP